MIIDKKFFQALAVMVGYIIGVGMFGLPFLASKSGIIAFGILFIFISLAQYFLHLLYANIICLTKDYHSLPGYIDPYFAGKKDKIIALLAIIINGYGALLAYTIISGVFLNQLLQPIFGGSEFIYASLLFFLEALILFFGIKIMAKTELVMAGLMLLAIIVISIDGLRLVEFANYKLFDLKYAVLPFGALLFALDGAGSLPVIARILDKNRKKMKQVIQLGILISALVTGLFAFVILGVSGQATSVDALLGVGGILSNSIIIIAFFFGILAMFTSFLGISQTLIKTYVWDYKLGEKFAWFLVMLVPYLMYVLGLKNFIGVISFVGAICGGSIALLLLWIFWSLKQREEREKRPGKYLILFKRRPSKIFIYLMMAMFAAGIIFEVVSFLNL